MISLCESRARKQTSVRKKCISKKNSECYKAALKLLQVREEDALKSAMVNQLQQSHTETSNILQTAYYIAQSDHPYTDHSELIKSHVLNGVNMKHVLHSNVTCTDIINHILC